jgi:hypothetical protein
MAKGIVVIARADTPTRSAVPSSFEVKPWVSIVSTLGQTFKVIAGAAHRVTMPPRISGEMVVPPGRFI